MCVSAHVCVCVCVLPSGTERFLYNVTPAATEREVNTQGRGTQGSVCMCVFVYEGHYSCGPCRSTEWRWMALAQRERELEKTHAIVLKNQTCLKNYSYYSLLSVSLFYYFTLLFFSSNNSSFVVLLWVFLSFFFVSKVMTSFLILFLYTGNKWTRK